MEDLAMMITKRIENAGIIFRKDKPKFYNLAKAACICFAIAYTLQIIALIKVKDNIDRLFEFFSVVALCDMAILKLISLYRNHKHWSLLLKTVREIEKEQFSKEVGTASVEYESDDEDFTPRICQQISSYTEKFKTISNFLSRMYASTVAFYMLSPFVEYALRKDKDLSERWPHILPGWAFFDKKSLVGYLFHIFFEIVTSIYCVLIHLAFDLASIGIMMFITGQFVILRKYSESIGGKGTDWQLSKRRDERAHHRIVKSHKIHVLLMLSTSALSKLLNNILGVYFFLATLSLCSVAVRLNSELSNMQLLSLLQYMCAALTQLFLFCRYGNDVLHESSVNMGRGPFGTAHWCLSPRVRRELAILGLGMMMPQRLYAGPFTSPDLPSFIQVIRTAYSYYAVIRK